MEIVSEYQVHKQWPEGHTNGCCCGVDGNGRRTPLRFHRRSGDNNDSKLSAFVGKVGVDVSESNWLVPSDSQNKCLMQTE